MRSSPNGARHAATPLAWPIHGLDRCASRQSPAGGIPSNDGGLASGASAPIAVRAGAEAFASGWPSLPVPRPSPPPRLAPPRLSPAPDAADDDFSPDRTSVSLDPIRRALTSAAASDAFLAVSRLFGMDRVAALPVLDSGPAASPFLFTNWPQSWIARHAEAGAMNDPARGWALLSGQAIGWTELRRRLPGSGPTHAVYAEAALEGYAEWLFAPVRTLRGRLGVVAVGGRRAAMTRTECDALRLAAEAAYNRADELVSRDAPALSPREAECVTQLALGAQFAEIATSLGVSVTTVRFHLDNARRKMGARSCTHLVALTLGAGSPAP